MMRGYLSERKRGCINYLSFGVSVAKGTRGLSKVKKKNPLFEGATSLKQQDRLIPQVKYI